MLTLPRGVTSPNLEESKWRCGRRLCCILTLPFSDSQCAGIWPLRLGIAPWRDVGTQGERKHGPILPTGIFLSILGMKKSSA